MIPLALLWLLAVNAWTFFCFGSDKRRAIYKQPRLLEVDLLGLAMIGGTAVAFAGRRYYRHKIRKKQFATQLRMIAAAQLGVLAGFALLNLHAA